LNVGGEAVELCADRALFWTRTRTLFVADVHLGKAAAFRAGGVPVPRGSTANDLKRLETSSRRATRRAWSCSATSCTRKPASCPRSTAAFVAWREQHAT
jgi:hypothetical protein